MKKKWLRVLLRQRFWIIMLLLIQMVLIAYFVISRSLESQIIRALFTIISIAVSLHIVAKKDKGAYKLTWVFLILLFPVFGGLLYLFVNFQSSTKRFRAKVSQSENKAREYSMLCDNGFEAAIKAVPQAEPQIRYLQEFAGFPIYTESTAKYLSSGEMKFEYLLRELEKAEKYIFLEYFIVEEGVMWDAILEVLKRKASQGVLVRLIYDDLGCFVLLPKDYPKRLKEFGIECVVFNKFKPILTVIQNNRDHRKIASIDGKVCFTGGINLADEYINAIEKHGHWKDSAVMIKGKAAWGFTLMFLQMWELCTGLNEDYSVYNPIYSFEEAAETDGFIQPYSDSPLDAENVGEHVYLHIINNAKRYVYINTPYLIIDDSMVSALTLAAKSGVDVRIVTPHMWDKFFVHMTTRSYYRELINAGVKVYEYSDGFIHSKTFVSDDITATVGTTNLDFRSLYLHFECGVQLYESKAVAEIKEDYLETLKKCRMITKEDCKCGFLATLFQDILRLFAPLM